MERGSVLVYPGSVFHGGGANASDAPRLGMNLTYCLNWLRQEENRYLSCPPEIARTFEPELQALMGYASGGCGSAFARRRSGRKRRPRCCRSKTRCAAIPCGSDLQIAISSDA